MKNLPAGTEMTRGIVTLANWTMMPDGETYLFVFGRWAILTDKAVAELASLPGFKSSEKWLAVGYGQGSEPAIIVPGCQVKGIVPCVKRPETRKSANQCYVL